MGLTKASVRFLAQARKRGARFDRTLVLGRQYLSASPHAAHQILREHGLTSLSEEEFEKAVFKLPYFAEPLLELLGAAHQDAMDVSDFEGAGIIHDLNQPIPNELKEQYHAVIDGGTLEHVFNFPQAVRNLMEMAKVDGKVFIFNVANNFCGHGFYQFSPELFFRVLSEENGYKIDRLVLLVSDSGATRFLGSSCVDEIEGDWYEVVDPAVAGARVEIVTAQPTMLFVEATRTAIKPIFDTTPQQSDYATQWQSFESDGANEYVHGSFGGGGINKHFTPAKLMHMKYDVLPAFARVFDPFHKWKMYRHRQVQDGRFFKKLPKDEI